MDRMHAASIVVIRVYAEELRWQPFLTGRHVNVDASVTMTSRMRLLREGR